MGALSLACIMRGVGCAWGVLYNTEKTSRDHIASYYSLMDSDCNGDFWGDMVKGPTASTYADQQRLKRFFGGLGEGRSIVNIMFFT